MNLEFLPFQNRRPDFNNLLAVLRREAPARPTLFEFYLNGPLYDQLAGTPIRPEDDPLEQTAVLMQAFKNAGYDYFTFQVPGFEFPSGEVESKASYSINQGGVIFDRDSFAAYAWPDPADGDYAMLDALVPRIPEGMKAVVCGPNGVLEVVIRLVGYEKLCYLMADDADLVKKIFDEVGTRLLGYYARCAGHEAVGACISNDDWGFKTQTMIAPRDLRRFVFPWHRRIVDTAHQAGKPVILHSCGNLEEVMDDIIDDMKFDGKHSFEDAILPVEEAYEKYGSRIAIMGGIDLDFVCRAAPEEILARSRAMVERAAQKGAFALGTGNSVPEYVPQENYFAMTRAVLCNK